MLAIITRISNICGIELWSPWLPTRKSRYHEYTSTALEVANSLLLVSSNTKIINFYKANTVLFALRLGRNHCYQRQICYPRSGQRKFRLRRAYPKDYYEESRI